ncbi:MAG: hypothetical protein IT323_19785 [Anaerolineae bacterium]|nr:hypothetical protein [Anaerolineae bacterium]
MTSTTPPLSQRVKPTLETRFHIDYDWWKREGRDLRAYLISHLLPEQRAQFENMREEAPIDWVDPATAEVRQVDALQQALAIAVRDAQFINERTALVDAIFRVFLANGNKPLTPVELGVEISRPAMTILRTLSGAQVYKGLRPVAE